MGTDIHTIVQVKENGEWRDNTENVFPNSFYCSYKEWREKDIAEGKPEEKCTQIPQWAKDEFINNVDGSRNYDWFAVLANVRNGFGFAGCVTGEGFQIISEPKGLPADFKAIHVEYEPGELSEQYMGDHSFSYVTIDEFNNFDWNQVTMKTGVIPIEEYIKLRNTNTIPEFYSGGISGPNIVTITEEEADIIIEGVSNGITNANTRFYVQYHWSILYSEWFAYKIESWITPMNKLKEKYEDVRVVFGFDS